MSQQSSGVQAEATSLHPCGCQPGCDWCYDCGPPVKRRPAPATAAATAATAPATTAAAAAAAAARDELLQQPVPLNVEPFCEWSKSFPRDGDLEYYMCEHCNVWANCEVNLQQHLLGKRHRQHLRRANLGGEHNGDYWKHSPKYGLRRHLL